MDRMNRLRRVCLAMTAVCVLAAGARVLSVAVAALDPRLSAPALTCSGVGCSLGSRLISFLPATQKAAAWRDAGAPQKLAARAAEPKPRLLLIGAGVLDALPAALVFLTLAMAFRRFARGAIFGGRAIIWLRRAALAGAASALASPVAASLRATALTPALTGREQIVLVVSAEQVLAGLFLAAVLWVAVWALEEGRSVREDLAGYV